MAGTTTHSQSPAVANGTDLVAFLFDRYRPQDGETASPDAFTGAFNLPPVPGCPALAENAQQPVAVREGGFTVHDGG